MNETVMRGTGALQWRELALLMTRVPAIAEPVKAAEAHFINRGGERLIPQRLIDFDGVTRMVTLPVRDGAGEWRATVEDGQRLYVFRRRDGSRSVICLD
jgi:hypothetical protein